MYNIKVKAHTRHFPFRKYPMFKQQSLYTYVARGLSKEEAKAIQRKMWIRGYRAYVYEERWDRSNNYRKIYMKQHPDKTFRCVYCGRVFPRDSITIDHVIPIDASTTSKLMRGWMKVCGYTGADDDSNLVPACYFCNHVKRNSKSVYWSVRAFLGKHITWWVLVWTVRILFFAGLAAVCIHMVLKSI